MSRSGRTLVSAVFAAALLFVPVAAAVPTLPPAGEYANFESGHVRPLAISPNGARLFAVNTPGNRLHIYDISGGTAVMRASVPVGLEPVAVAARNDTEVWVVNHLSDSISIVDVAATPPRVRRTLQVGDEPRDIVFAGPNRARAFITTAHRGQNTLRDPLSFTPGVGRADVWVFNTASLGEALRGTPLTVLNLFGDTPRPLAVSPDGSRVYVAVFNSGNRTTVLQADIANGGLDKPGPQADAFGNEQPKTGLIVRHGNGHWTDNGDPEQGEAPRTWDSRVRFTLPDYDVFQIDATATPPVEARRFAGVGTTLFNMVVNPVNGTLFVSNQEALNHVRFEGPGEASTTVRGHFVESRITAIRNNGTVLPRHLNKHITSYDSALGTDAEKSRSLATPLGMAVRSDGTRLYVAAYGSQRVGWFLPAELDANTFVPNAARQIPLGGGGPTGLVLDESRNRLYVLTRFDNGISTIDLTTHAELQHFRMFSPEPVKVVAGRKFLYDARLTSSRGDSSCAGCHIFGDMDHISWDLGNPDEARVASPNEYNSAVPSSLTKPTFHPMKGPMSTQSLRGMSGHGPLHWRGDRTGVTRTASESLEEQAFEDFNVAFTGLLGRANPLATTEMDAFAKFALTMLHPPNPHRNLDNSLSAAQRAGEDFYNNTVSDTIATCNGCHVLNEDARLFGTDGTMSIEGGSIAEDFKIPHLRNTYQKVGMFGSTGNPGNGTAQRGAQIRGFGFAHDGAVDTLNTFLSAGVFAFPTAEMRTNVARFVLAFPTDFAPVVGQQVTIHPGNSTNATVRSRVSLLYNRARLGTPRRECDLVAAGVIDAVRFSSLLNSESSFTRANVAGTTHTLSALYAAAARTGNAITFTCVPPGSGLRIGIDRNGDGVADAEN